MTMAAMCTIIAIADLQVAGQRILAEVTRQRTLAMGKGESDETYVYILFQVFDNRIVGGCLGYFTGGGKGG
jgi:hypothetical protein